MTQQKFFTPIISCGVFLLGGGGYDIILDCPPTRITSGIAFFVTCIEECEPLFVFPDMSWMGSRPLVCVLLTIDQGSRKARQNEVPQDDLSLDTPQLEHCQIASSTLVTQDKLGVKNRGAGNSVTRIDENLQRPWLGLQVWAFIETVTLLIKTNTHNSFTPPPS